MVAAIEMIREFFRRMNSNDFAYAAELLSEDFVLEWPQSAERIRGRVNFVAVNAEYPAQGPWCFTINRLVGNESEVVSDVSVTDGAIHARAITFHTLQAGLICRQVEFWPEDYPAPTNRHHLVEPLDQSWTASGG
jgi:ketosteroid isomerase-like protein